MPCARAMRPTTAIAFQSITFTCSVRLQADPAGRLKPATTSLLLVRRVANLERHGLALVLAGRRRQRTKGRDRPALPSDHLPCIAGRDVQLDERRTFVLRLHDAHVVGPVGQRTREHLDDSLDAHYAFGAASAAAGFGVKCRAI